MKLSRVSFPGFGWNRLPKTWESLIARFIFGNYRLEVTFLHLMPRIHLNAMKTPKKRPLPVFGSVPLGALPVIDFSG